MLFILFLFQVDDCIQAFHQQGFQGNVGFLLNDDVAIYSIGDRVLGEAPHDEQSSFRIGSLTKSMTAIATLAAIEDHGISLNTRISQFFPQFNEKYGELTIEQLLRMQSGFPNHMLRITQREDLNLMQMVDMIAQSEPLFQPGNKTQYSNCNYHVLAFLLQTIEKRPFAQVLTERVFKPLEMTQSYVEMENAPNSRGYDFKETWRNAEAQPMNMTTGSGDVVSTVRDLLIYGRAMLEKRGPFARYWENLSQSQDPERGYTMGWRIKKYNRLDGSPSTYIRHGGSMRGFLSNLHVYPEEQLVVVVLANTRPFPIMDFTESLTRARLSEE